PSPGEIPASSGVPLERLLLELVLLEFDPIELESPAEADEAPEFEERPELDRPLTVVPLVVPEDAVSPGAELPVVGPLPHAPANAGRHARHPVSANEPRTLPVVLPIAM